jgi:membrane protease YdiL (CAAX protease family)
MIRVDPSSGDQPADSTDLPVEPAPPPAQPLPAPAPGPRLPGWKMLLGGVAVIWAFELVIGVIYVVARAAIEGPRSLADDVGPVGVVFTTVLGTATTFAVISFIICRLCRFRFDEGFAVKPVRPPVFAASVILGISAAIAAILIESAFGSQDSYMARLASMPGGLPAIVVVALLAPPFEELYYRGFIFPILRRRLGVVPAVTLVALWFAGVHAFQLYGDPAGILVILVMGLVWTLQEASDRVPDPVHGHPLALQRRAGGPLPGFLLSAGPGSYAVSSQPGRYSRTRYLFASGTFVTFMAAASQTRRRPPSRSDTAPRLKASEIGPARRKSP